MKPTTQGSRKRGKRITWKDGDGNIVDLTGAIITARIQNVATGAVVASDGTFSIVAPGTNGVFTWAFGANDIATAGDYKVQFTATYPDALIERTYADTWTVLAAV